MLILIKISISITFATRLLAFLLNFWFVTFSLVQLLLTILRTFLILTNFYNSALIATILAVLLTRFGFSTFFWFTLLVTFIFGPIVLTVEGSWRGFCSGSWRDGCGCWVKALTCCTICVPIRNCMRWTAIPTIKITFFIIVTIITIVITWPTWVTTSRRCSWRGCCSGS